MTAVLKYGSDSEVTLEIPEENLLADCGRPMSEPIDDPAAAVAAGLISPLEFPAFAECVLPDDRLAIVLDDELPQVAELAVGVVQAAIDAKIDPTGITLVCGNSSMASEVATSIKSVTGHGIDVKVHDPTDRDELAYLGVSAEGKSIYINRTIVDAEFVLPVGCMRLESATGYHGVHGTIYPAFSDEEARKRFDAPSNEEFAAHRRRRRGETEEVARLLGVTMTVQVVPGSRGEVLETLVGETGAVARRGKEVCDTLWNYSIPGRASLVIAGIEGDGRSQTWENVARAISAARTAVTDEGAIAICTELDCQPGAALQRLVDIRDAESMILDLKKERSTDAAAAIQLLQVLEQHPVYLLSRLDDETVEDLGMAPIGDLADLNRLSQRHESCILLSNAQFAIAELNDSDDANRDDFCEDEFAEDEASE